MRRWFHVLVPLMLIAPTLEAQAIPPSRFASTVPTYAGVSPEVGLAPRICRMSKGFAVLRGAYTGVVVVGLVTFLYVFTRVVIQVASFRGDMVNFPILELAAAGAIIGGVLGGADWERQCG
jgi:hypothetical protein